jgi:hypothetical protein
MGHARGGAQPAGDVAGIVQQDHEAGPLNSAEAEEDAGVGFDEIAEQAEGHVGNHEEFEGVAREEAARDGLVVGVGVLRLRRDFAALRPGFAQDDNTSLNDIENRDESEKERDFVQLRWVARDVVAEVDGPGERGRNAVGVVGEAGEEASDAADGDAESEGDGVKVPGGVAKSDVAFREFDGDEPEGEGPDNSLASDEVVGIVEMMPGESRVFEPE